MPKVKSHAKWNGLSKGQRKTLEEWLFEERMGYTKAWGRAKKELGFTGSLSSLRRYYSRTADERTLAEFAESARVMESVDKAPVDAESLRDSGMKVAAQVFFRLVRERPEELKAWLPLAKLLAQCEKNDSWRAVKDEENEIRKTALQFARVRFQYDAIDAGLKALPKLIALKQARDRAEMTVYDDNKMMNDLRLRLFGEGIPDLLPENEEEEAHPEIIERRIQEGRLRRQEQFAREHRERQKEQAEEKARKEGKDFAEANRAEAGEMEEDESAGRQPAGNFTEANEGNEGTQEQAGGGAGEASDKLKLEQKMRRTREREPEIRGKSEDDKREETGPDERNVFVDEPRKLSAGERQREYEELMRRARGC